MRSLSDEYELLRKLGEGWAGETWMGKLLSPRFGLPAGTKVALKRYKEAIFRQALNIAKRIEREADIGRTIDHENLVKVYALEKFIDEEGAEVWVLVMQLCSSGDLSHFLTDHGPIDGNNLRHIAYGIATGLYALHGAGVTHRDIKPENILIGSDRCPKIGDFGVIRNIEESTITGSAEFLGTIRYSAPEVLQGADSTQASDVYSFGTVLYRLLYNLRPYDQLELFSAVVTAVVGGPPDIPTESNRFVTDISLVHIVLEAICKRLLNTDPAKRPSIKIVLKWLDASPHCPPFFEELADIILRIIREHIYDWAQEADQPKPIFTTYSAWCLARKVSNDDALSLFRDKSPAILYANPEYRSIALSLRPTMDEYRDLSRDQRLAFARALQYHQESYVHEIWDEKLTIAQRDRSYMFIVKKFTNV